MPLSIPSRRRGKLATAAKTARRIAVIRAATALVQTKLGRKLPGRKRKRAVTPVRAAAVGGLVAGVAGLIRSRRSGGGDGGGGGSQVPGGPVPPPAPANYDAPGPPSNTATPVPEPVIAADATPPEMGIDEEAEVAAAAAEAASIGGPAPDYAPSALDEELDEVERPLAEAGQGVSEGQEQAEGDLVELATTDIGPGAGQTDAERLIEETIEQQSNPQSGETADLPSAPPGDK